MTYQGQNYSKVKGDKNKGEKYLFIHKAVRFIHIVSTRGNFSHQDLSTRLERPQSASGRASWTEEGAGWGRKPLSEEEQARRHCQLLNTTITAPPSAVTACHAL